MMLHEVSVGFGGGSLLQVANRSNTQMMSYLIETPDGKLVMIDGGYYCQGDAEYLYELLCRHGKHVDLWFISHAHDDHYGALLWLMEKMERFDVSIDRLCFNFPSEEWLKTIENGGGYDRAMLFLEEIKRHEIPVQTVYEGDIFECGGLKTEVLNTPSEDEKYKMINDTSIMLLVHFPKRDVLFLGDMGWDSGDDYLRTHGNEKIRCDIVQLAHHGQNGVTKEFYQAVQPKICLYTAPDWLWENDIGGGKGSGPWKTLEVREWMEELSVEQSCPAAYGDYILK